MRCSLVLNRHEKISYKTCRESTKRKSYQAVECLRYGREMEVSYRPMQDGGRPERETTSQCLFVILLGWLGL